MFKAKRQIATAGAVAALMAMAPAAVRAQQTIKVDEKDMPKLTTRTITRVSDTCTS